MERKRMDDPQRVAGMVRENEAKPGGTGTAEHETPKAEQQPGGPGTDAHGNDCGRASQAVGWQSGATGGNATAAHDAQDDAIRTEGAGSRRTEGAMAGAAAARGGNPTAARDHHRKGGHGSEPAADGRGQAAVARQVFQRRYGERMLTFELP